MYCTSRKYSSLARSALSTYLAQGSEPSHRSAIPSSLSAATMPASVSVTLRALKSMV